MKYITLTRGNEAVWYPVYELKSEYLDRVTTSPLTTTISGVTGIAVSAVIPTQLEEPLQNAFADTLPETAEDFGSILQTQHRYAPRESDGVLDLVDAEWQEIPIGTKPDDWDTNWFDYFQRGYSSYYQIGTVTGVYPATQISIPPTWGNNVQYYKNVIDVRRRFCHVFKTGAGYTFGIYTNAGIGDAGYNKHYSRLGTLPGVNIYNPSASFLWRTPQDSAMGFHFDANQQWRVENLVALNLMNGIAPGETIPYNSIPLTDNRREFFAFISTTYNNVEYYGIMAFGLSGGGAPVFVRSILFNIDLWGKDSISDNPPEPEPQEGEWGDPIGRAGGHGSFSDPSDDSGAFDGTALAADIAAHAAVMNANIQAGGFHVYRLAAGAMAAISRVLFSQSFFGLFTVSRYNPLSCILSYHLLPATLAPLTLDGTAQTAAVKAGGYNFNTDPDAPVQVPAQSLVDSETHYFVGAADIPLYYDAFPDFAPFTNAKIHLPYIGEMALDINKFQGGRIAVDYNCDVLSGNVCAVITCQDRNNRRREVYTATGNAAYTLPVFSESQSGAAVGKLIGTGVTAAVTGNAAGVLGAAAGAMEMAAVGVPHSPQIQGSFGGNVGAIGNRICFLEITRPEWVETERFQELTGIPSGLSGTIADLGASGFIQVQTIETDGITATQAECDLIEQILKSGIYLK